MIQKFIENKYEIVDASEKADIYIINTCTVTNISDRKSRQMLRKPKEINKSAIIVACGCYAQVAKEELESLDEIDLVLGNNEKADIVECVEKYLKECLDHIINQTFRDIEIICINDGSTDSSLDILNDYASKDRRIKIISRRTLGLQPPETKVLRLQKDIMFTLWMEMTTWIYLPLKNCMNYVKIMTLIL